MKIALIPPTPDLKVYAPSGDMHLVLSHQLREDKDYRNYYKEAGKRGDYIILDNGAHENNAGEGIEELLVAANSVRAREIVLPDVLFDGPATAAASFDAMHELKGHGLFEAFRPTPALMVVPQGKDEKAWVSCFYSLIKAYQHFGLVNPLVVGVSKDYEMWPGGIPRLLRKYVGDLLNDGHRFDVHLLGWGRDLWVLREMAMEFKWLRSTDSAKPFVYAREGISLNSERMPPPYPGRQFDYFHRSLDLGQRTCAWENIGTFSRTARGEL